VHLVNEHNINAHIVCKSPDINAPYKFADNKKIRIINDTEFKSTLYLWSWIKSVSPNAIYISGWNNLKYLIIAIYYSKKIPTIIGLDNPWIGSFKQYILSGIGNITISHMFSHCWVAGPPQYVYAKKLGFKYHNILKGLYCANIPSFKHGFKQSSNREKKIIFVGRFVEYKKPIQLVKVFSKILCDNKNNDWSLELIGNGPLKKELIEYECDKIIISEFLDPIHLPAKFAQASFLCLPSSQEHWGVVVHEAVASGLGLILSDTVYSFTSFLIHGHNGFLFKDGNWEQLEETLIKVFNLNQDLLNDIHNLSQHLANSITHDYWSRNLLSTLIK